MKAYLDHLVDVALRTSILCGVLHLHQHYEVKVVPHVVLFLDVLFESHRFVIKFVPLKPCRDITQGEEMRLCLHRVLLRLG